MQALIELFLTLQFCFLLMQLANTLLVNIPFNRYVNTNTEAEL